MSKYDYDEGMKISAKAGFYALLFAAIRKADLVNRNRLAKAFPNEVAEFTRLNGGSIPLNIPPNSVSLDDIEQMIEDAELAGE